MKKGISCIDYVASLDTFSSWRLHWRYHYLWYSYYPEERLTILWPAWRFNGVLWILLSSLYAGFQFSRNLRHAEFLEVERKFQPIPAWEHTGTDKLFPRRENLRVWKIKSCQLESVFGKVCKNEIESSILKMQMKLRWTFSGNIEN